MSRATVRLVFGLTIWSLVLVGALSIATQPGDWGHSICGAWGCGPPLQALIGCHLAWIVVLLPAGIWLRFSLPNGYRSVIGWSALAISVLGIVGLVCYEWITWWNVAKEFQREYFRERVMFSIATRIELPLIQLFFVGLLLVLPRSERIRRDSLERSSASNSERMSSVVEPFNDSKLDPKPAVPEISTASQD